MTPLQQSMSGKSFFILFYSSIHAFSLFIIVNDEIIIICELNLLTITFRLKAAIIIIDNNHSRNNENNCSYVCYIKIIL